MKNVAVAVALAVLTGCSPAGDADAPSPLEFSPQDGAAWAAFETAAEMFVDHAGFQPLATAGGTTVRFAPRPEGGDTCGDTTASFWSETLEVVSVDIAIYVPVPAGCYPDPSTTLAHEMIHAMRAWAGMNLGTPNHGHSDGGLFNATAGDPRFTAATLEKICEAVDCPAFNVEE